MITLIMIVSWLGAICFAMGLFLTLSETETKTKIVFVSVILFFAANILVTGFYKNKPIASFTYKVEITEYSGLELPEPLILTKKISSYNWWNFHNEESASSRTKDIKLEKKK